MLKALIFDVDGTLADTERDGHRPAFNQAFAQVGLAWHWDVTLYGRLLAVTGGKERMRYYAEGCRHEAVDPVLIDRLHGLKTEYYTALVGTGAIPLRPGVRRLLQEARAAGLLLAIATTTTPANVEVLLHATLGPGTLSWFQVVGAGDVVPAKKPAPDIYQHVLAQLGLDAGACLAFEDSENGLRSAVGAGVRTVVTVTEYTQDQSFSGAALVVSDLGELDCPATVYNGPARVPAVVDLAWLRQLAQS